MATPPHFYINPPFSRLSPPLQQNAIPGTPPSDSIFERSYPHPHPPLIRKGGSLTMQLGQPSIFEVTIWKYILPRLFLGNVFAEAGRILLRASVFTLATSAKILMRSKLVRFFPLLHISPRIRSIMCAIIVVQFVVQILLYAMQCALSSL